MGSWVERGICRKLNDDEELQRTFQMSPADVARKFYPLGQTDKYKEDIVSTKRICSQCPVQEECLQWALIYEENGTWGGCTEWERRKIRKSGVVDVSNIGKHHTNKKDALNCRSGKGGKQCNACQTYLKSTYGKMYKRECKGCDVKFKTNRPNQSYHSPACARRHTRQLRLEAQSA